ncbi:MAG: hypothetical protein J0I11_12775 [Actinobacteria bacterium]|nr:hypothetical protein [Actinomycetota bacterium]
MGTQAMKHRVVDKLLDASAAILGFIALVFVSIGLAGETPFQVWGPGTGIALAGIGVLAIVARRWSRRENDAQGEPPEGREIVEAKISPVKKRDKGKYLEAMMIASLGIATLSSYLILGDDISWKIWGPGLAIGIAGLVVGAVIVRRGKNRDQERATDSDAGDSEV